MTVASLTDPQRRLLATIGQRLSVERVHELYLFAPMRQGGVETGLAVVAAAVPDTAEELPSHPVEALPADAPGAAGAAGLLAEQACDPTDAAAGAPPSATADVADAVALPGDAGAADLAAATSIDGVGAGDGARLDHAVPADGEPDGASPPGDAAADATRPDAVPPPLGPAAAPARFTVYTARYRLQLKGPERGRWEAELVEEADAPLVSVDAVVRGVQRRLGESAEVERLTGAELVRLLVEGA